MQDHPAQAPFADRAGPSDSLPGNAEVGRRGRAEQGRDLRGSRAGLVHRSSIARRRRAGDPAAPGEGRLASFRGVVAVGIGRCIAGRYVQQQEWIKGDAQPARLHLPDRLCHGKICWRSAINRAVLGIAADQKGIGAAALGKKLGLIVTSAKEENRGRVYRISLPD